ncbi:MAG: glycine oxidase ThiO [Gaiellaceae bacterium]
MEERDVVVVGGGPIGLASAWRAAQRGLDVVVLERDRAGSGASSVAAGLLAPVTEAEHGEEEFLRLGLDSLGRWPAFAAELEEASGLEIGFLACGTLAVALDRDDAEELRRAHDLHERLGLATQWLLPSEARRLEPGLAPGIAAAFLAETECAVDPRRLTAALAAALGERLVEGARVTRALVETGRITGVETSDGREFRAAKVVAAGGAWGTDWLPAEAAPPVRPVKGEVLVLRGEALVSRSVRTIGPHHVYLVPRGDGRLVVGATMLERGDTTVTAGGVLELLREAYRVLPEIAELELLEARASLRPGSPDNLPIVGPGALDGLVLATGHHRNGILLTPHTADTVAELLA